MVSSSASIPVSSVPQPSAEEKKHIARIFQQLKPLCDRIVGNPTREYVVSLTEAIDQVDDSQPFYHLWQYATFPIQFQLGKFIKGDVELSSWTVVELLRCMKTIVSKIRLDSIDQFVHVHQIMFQVLSKYETNTYEEINRETIDCVRQLYENLSTRTRYELYNVKWRSLHAQTVYQCTQIARQENYLQARIISLKCILTVFGDVPEFDHDDSSRYQQYESFICDMAASMLPGVISACHYVISSSSILHHDLYMYCIRVFGKSVSLVYNSNERNENDENVEKNLFVPDKHVGKTSNSIRTEEWLRETSDKIAIFANCLLELCANEHWKVRLEIVNTVTLILSANNSSVTASFSLLLFECLVILSADSLGQVSKSAETSLTALASIETVNSEKFKQSLKERFFQHLISLNSTVDSDSEERLLTQLQTIGGYLRVLNARSILKSEIHFNNFFATLKKVIRFDRTVVNLREETIASVIGAEHRLSNEDGFVCWKHMKFLSRRTEAEVKNICDILTINADYETITFCLLGLLEKEQESRNELLYLVNNVVLNGNIRFEGDDCSYLLERILNIYATGNSSTLKYPTDKRTNSNANPIVCVQNNVIQTCLCMDGVSRVASGLASEFKRFLPAVLYHILEKTGCANRTVSVTAVNAAEKIAKSCDYRNVTELISDNIDTVAHNIYRRLRDVKRNRAVFDVFCGIIIHCEKDSLFIVFDVMQTLLQSKEVFRDEYCDELLRVFGVFTRKLRSFFAPIAVESTRAVNESDEIYFDALFDLEAYVDRSKRNEQSVCRPSDLADCDIDLNRIFESEELDLSDEQIDDDVKEEESNDDVAESLVEEPKPATPAYVELTVRLVDRILLVAARKNVDFRRVRIFEVLIDALLILSNRETELLPMVHKIWTRLAAQFAANAEEPLLMRRAFELLCVMAVVARDFIRNRIVERVLPSLCDYLIASADGSKLKGKNSAYRSTQKYKLQRTLLRQIGCLAAYICLEEKHCYAILKAVAPYTSSLQPLPLQNASVNVLRIVERRYQDMVCLFALSLRPYRTVYRSLDSRRFNEIKLKTNENSPRDSSKNLAIFTANLERYEE